MSRTAPVTVVATEDYDLRLRVSEREPGAYLGEPLTSCRVHQGSLSANERFRRGSTKFTLRSRATTLLPRMIDPAIRQLHQPRLRHRRTRRTPAQILQLRAIARRHPRAGVHREAVQLRTQSEITVHAIRANRRQFELS